MRKLFGQALDQAAAEPNIVSEQHIYLNIIGNEEIWSEALRRDAQPAGKLQSQKRHPNVLFLN